MKRGPKLNSVCARGHPQSKFRSRKGKDQTTYCTLCAKITNQRWLEKKRQEDPDWQRRKHLKLNWGLTIADYDEMLENQNGQCAICGTEDFGSKRGAVDHNHKTGEIRGILCSKCNQGLGLFNDDVESLNSAIQYLKDR